MTKTEIIIKEDGYGIEDINLSELDIYKVVNYWYNHLEPDIFQNEQGEDLGEVMESLIYNKNK